MHMRVEAACTSTVQQLLPYIFPRIYRAATPEFVLVITRLTLTAVVAPPSCIVALNRPYFFYAVAS